MNLNIEDEQLQYINSSDFINKLSYLSSNSPAFLQTTLSILTKIMSCQSETLTFQSISDVQVIDEEDGFILKMDLEYLKSFKELIINRIIQDLKLSLDKQLIDSIIPLDNIKVFANSLMNISDIRIQSDLNQWLKEQQLQTINNQYKYIRYFYFTSTESYQQNEPPINYGLEIVNYKNQITVLIDQPLLYSSVFKKIVYFLEKYEDSLLEINSNFQDLLVTAQEFHDVLKQLFLMRISKNNSFQVNQYLFKYINNDNNIIEVLQGFVNYLFQLEKLDNNEVDMQIFWKALNVQVVSYFSDGKRLNNNSQNDKQTQESNKMEVAVVFETFSKGEINFQNCYIIYNKQFMQSQERDKDKIKILPLICNICQDSTQKSTEYIIEKLSEKRNRVCYKCQKK